MLSLAGATLLATTFASFGVVAQEYPQRPITIVVPFAAGGGTDNIARAMAGPLQEKLGQPVVIENRGGGGGSIGAAQVAKAKPDGYTLLFVTSSFVTNAAIDKSLPYDVVTSFTPISLLGRGPLLVVTNKNTGIKTIEELIQKAKQDPEALNYASAGPGSINHLAGALFTQRTGTTMQHIPYQGSGPATFDLLGGNVEVFFATAPTMLGHVKTNEVNLLATTGKERGSLFADTPTVAETGVKDFEVYTWWGIVGPVGLPADIVSKLNQAINDIAASQDLQKRFTDEGAETFKGTPDQFAQALKSEFEHWRKLAEDAKIMKQ
jgi:tripartite-type tricarboxylate transporter receptor subunit TctC